MTPAPRIGTEFAGYRIEGLLGRGGMGVVYRAEHPRLGAIIALKVMAPDVARDETYRERFVREARVAARIRHPNIVPIYDAGEWQGDLYLAMRYVEGDDLRDLIRVDGALPAEKASEIGVQIGSALDAAHRNGVVHRDVKPGNILLEPGPDPDSPAIAYLADLGLTKQLSAQGGVTGSDELLGTIDYMAPEQISGAPVDGRADVYSLACVLYECLTGAAPFVRDTRAAVLWAHLHDEVPRASDANPSLPRAVDAVLARGMAKMPADRFDTARELTTALRTALDGAALAGDEARTSAAGGQPVERDFAATLSSRVRRRRTLALATGIGAIVGGGLAAALLFLVLGADAPSPSFTSAPTTTHAQGPAAATLTAFDEALLRYVPDEIRPSCRHAEPLTSEFDATLSCDPGGVVDSLTYSHARSGRYLYEFMGGRRAKAGLPSVAPPARTGLCSAGQTPSLNDTIAVGFSGRAEVPNRVERDELLGRLLCAVSGKRARIEWLTQEAAIFAIAGGKDLAELYDWWSNDAGPEP